jgi:type IV secretion system protein VirB3
VATVAGVPLVPLVVLVVGAACTSVLLGVVWLLLIVPGWVLMAQVTKSDDRAFRSLWLWMQTKVVNRLRFWGRSDLWCASSYSPSDERRRMWEGEGDRWGG